MPVSVQNVSRRQFLQGSLALGAAAVLPRVLKAAPSRATSLASAVIGRPTTPLAEATFDHLALISDVHVSGGFSGIMAQRLSTAVNQVLALPQKPERVLVAGDCAYLTGKGHDYREYIHRIGPLVNAGLPVYMTLGNHDNRDHFWEALPTEQVSANQAVRRQSMVVPGKHANWFLLDSLDKTNTSPGELGKDQLEWLSAELDARTDKPALLMFHHDVIRDNRHGALMDADKLMDIVRPRRHVKALFWGHTHIWAVRQDKSGIHMINLPATGYTLWMRSFLGWTNCQVYRDSATLTIHTLKPGEAEDGLVVNLKWRAA